MGEIKPMRPNKTIRTHLSPAMRTSNYKTLKNNALKQQTNTLLIVHFFLFELKKLQFLKIRTPILFTQQIKLLDLF
ncbi:hypothetical protein BOW57_20190 [Flavobacterium sp. YO64]|nr:hypothetical protein BOW57_20190 [Flavobacterium sp. YO64]